MDTKERFQLDQGESTSGLQTHFDQGFGVRAGDHQPLVREGEERLSVERDGGDFSTGRSESGPVGLSEF